MNNTIPRADVPQLQTQNITSPYKSNYYTTNLKPPPPPVQ